jgi:uncharacterized protein YciI
MPKWKDYRQASKDRGSLAFELYLVESTPAVPPEQMMEILPDHLAYQGEMEAQGKLFLAGPLSDASGEEMRGSGMIVYNASSLEEATQITQADPMHARGGRTFTIRRWLVNEGSMTLSVKFSAQTAGLHKV